ncbi:MAG: aspartate kinase [Gammaproteobacteria bacterium]|nr:aspartate kinase [Gammaproteobacteria bacterium]
MAFYVQKFGGTSVGSVERINAVASRVAGFVRGGDRVVVVVSAMSGETNRLEALGGEVLRGPPSEAQAREMDVLLSAGEQASIALVAMAITRQGCPARSYLGDQVRIRTDANHMKARIESIDTKCLLADLDRGITPVVAGFQGMNESGDITTFGRGASDTTAVAVAAALGVDECRIYTDVPGVFTADPRIVPDARRLDSVTFEEMLELASLGSKVLHARSVEFVGKYGVPMRVLSSFEDGLGTLVTTEDQDMEQPVVSAIAHTRDEAKLTVQGVPDVPGVASRILGPVGEASIEVDMIVQNVGADGLADFTFTVRRADYERAREIVESVQSDLEARAVTGDDRIAKVSAVGVGMRSHAGVATRMFDALAAKNINILMISTSEIKISVVVDEHSLEAAVNAIHDAFELGADATA